MGISILGDPQDEIICFVEGDRVNLGYTAEGGNPWKERGDRELPGTTGYYRHSDGEKLEEGPVDFEVGG